MEKRRIEKKLRGMGFLGVTEKRDDLAKETLEKSKDVKKKIFKNVCYMVYTRNLLKIK